MLIVIMLIVIMLGVQRMRVLMLSVIMLSVLILSVLMLNVSLLNVLMLSVVRLDVTAPLCDLFIQPGSAHLSLYKHWFLHILLLCLVWTVSPERLGQKIIPLSVCPWKKSRCVLAMKS
jgi:hypothetical protein